MRVIPVLDILGDEVVHGIAGERSRYLPIESTITQSTAPVDVAGDLGSVHPFDELYIADLDAIQGRGDNLEHVMGVMDLGYQVYLDAGIGRAEDLSSQLRRVDRIVVGTETLASIDELRAISRLHRNVVASLDFKGEGLVARDKSLAGVPPEELVRIVSEAGAKQVIYLDLRRVGTGSGIRSSRMVRVLEASELPVIVGGGVRGASDISELGKLGADGVLVATCLHNGALSGREVARLTSS